MLSEIFLQYYKGIFLWRYLELPNDPCFYWLPEHSLSASMDFVLDNLYVLAIKSFIYKSCYNTVADLALDNTFTSELSFLFLLQNSCKVEYLLHEFWTNYKISKSLRRTYIRMWIVHVNHIGLGIHTINMILLSLEIICIPQHNFI